MSMSGIIGHSLVSRQGERLHLSSKSAKARLDTVNKVHPETTDWIATAHAMRRAITLAGLSDKEAAAEARVSPQHLAMMLAADKRPQSERFYASRVLRGPMLIAQAEQDPQRFDVVTTITVRRLS
jgi:hypothetical protein